jgi:hypothetical protein
MERFFGSKGNFMFLGVILCGEFPNPENDFLIMIQGKIVILKMRKMTIFASKTQFFPESGSGKHFHASAMCAIDFSHDFTPRNDLFRKNFFLGLGHDCHPL